ncbi:MAG: RNA polymerase sigma-24 factor [Treponematales bacterium]
MFLVSNEEEQGAEASGVETPEFRFLYERAFPILFRVARKIAGSDEAAEDLCQEAFFRLYEKEMVFPSPDEAKYWLIRVIKNASLNYAKRKVRERRAYQRAFREETRAAETGEYELIRKETRKEVQEALEKLPPNLKVVLVLKEYGELNYREIGRALGISEGNVKVRVFRARERLSGLLGDAGAGRGKGGKGRAPLRGAVGGAVPGGLRQGGGVLRGMRREAEAPDNTRRERAVCDTAGNMRRECAAFEVSSNMQRERAAFEVSSKEDLDVS